MSQLIVTQELLTYPSPSLGSKLPRHFSYKLLVHISSTMWTPQYNERTLRLGYYWPQQNSIVLISYMCKIASVFQHSLKSVQKIQIIKLQNFRTFWEYYKAVFRIILLRKIFYANMGFHLHYISYFFVRYRISPIFVFLC